MQVALCNGQVGLETQMFSSCGYLLYHSMVVVLMMQQLLKGFLKPWWYACCLHLDSCLPVFFQCSFDVYVSHLDHSCLLFPSTYFVSLSTETHLFFALLLCLGFIYFDQNIVMRWIECGLTFGGYMTDTLKFFVLGNSPMFNYTYKCI